MTSLGALDAAPALQEAEPAPRLRTATASPGRAAVALQSGAALLWIPQAALLSLAVGNMGAGAGAGEAVLPAAGILLIGVMRAVMDRAGTRIAFSAARRQLTALRADAVVKLARRSPIDASRPSSGLVASTLAEQAEAIVPYRARFTALRYKAAFVPLAILASVLALSWAAALILLVAAPLIPLFMALIGWRAKEASERQLAEMGGMNAFLLDRLRGLSTIRTFGAVDRTARRVRDNAEDLRKRTMAVLRIAFLSSAVLELFAALGVAMVAVYVGFHYLGALDFGAWGSKLPLGEGLFILLLAPAFFEPLRDLSSVWHDRAAGEAALEAVRKVAVEGPALLGAVENAPAKAASVHAPGACIENLRFRYTGQVEPVFDGLALEIRPGEHVAVTAPSGGGKSTLLALIAGLARPEEGVIRIGGEPLNDATAPRLRAGMAWIGQTPHLFSGTLSGNVALGRPGIGAADIGHALKLARLDTLSARRGSAALGEDGRGLSGGEALRLALARVAAASGAGLILADEPTAHLDRGTAAEITDMLLAASAGRTLIVATHDPVLAARMDRIVTLPAACAGEGCA
ncbi:thiol reductant ABC exporter subunit CydD [Chelativorans sp. AA-79]|uniref:thiol reductant ABC exporter subunit CydD n=1 Tax=Chelativorans sp. AA-79 TaxID=3028735 RepID=UPI0023F6355E|nr:thiol reductant ABC exporter subunit CydD [Chelativorans sp. AA-79]WEX08285.1 thiol reductant ABC exporter subunit CydD [Chelativorans sp. AA-79]